MEMSFFVMPFCEEAMHVPCKKRHLHAKQKVSFTYNPEAERRGHLLKKNRNEFNTPILKVILWVTLLVSVTRLAITFSLMIG